MNAKTKLATVLLLLCLYSATGVIAQTTGSFETTISFMSAPRAVSMYVPTTYTSATPHKLMICLHGLGDTCTNYRTGLIVSAAWGTNIPNTIFMCPEAYNRNWDYFYPTGDEAIIQACIDSARAWYNIDTTEIVLQGFSLGGRAALRYGLDNYNKFKGLLLNTPAVQGVKEALNGGTYNFNYANASHIPIFMTHGATDLIYTGPVDSTFEQLVLQDGIVRFRDYPGLGHALPPIAGMLDFSTFFTSPNAPGYDLNVLKPVIAAKSCVTSLPASCLVRNTGANTIHSIALDFSTSSGTYAATWTGTLAPYQHAFVTIPSVTGIAGANTLSVTVTSLESGVTDTITHNNSAAAPFNVQTSGLPLPYFEGFETATFPPANWTAYTAGDAYAQWDLDNDVKKTGTGSMYAFNTILIFDNSGRSDEVAMPVIDLTSGVNPRLTFDLSYNYHHYTPPYLVDTVFADTLSIMVSTDCGDTYTTVYKKGGMDLTTFSMPILNPTSIGADFIDPTASDWRTEDVDLSSYTTHDKVIIKFSYKSALGGSINIDNVGVANSTSVKEVHKTTTAIFPNPASNLVNVATDNEPIVAVSITDIAGKQVKQVNGNGGNNAVINTTDLADGVYTIKVVTPASATAHNLVVTHQ